MKTLKKILLYSTFFVLSETVYSDQITIGDMIFQQDELGLTSMVNYTPWNFGIIPYQIDAAVNATTRQQVEIQFFIQNTIFCGLRLRVHRYE